MSKRTNYQKSRKQVRAVLKANPLATAKGTAGKMARVKYGAGISNRDIDDTKTDRPDQED